MAGVGVPGDQSVLRGGEGEAEGGRNTDSHKNGGEMVCDKEGSEDAVKTQ